MEKNLERSSSVATVTAREETENVLEFHLSGEIDYGSSESVVGPSIENEMTGKIVDVVIDLTKVTYIDSEGLKLLLAIRARQLRQNKKMSLRLPGGRCLKIMELLGVQEIFEIID